MRKEWETLLEEQRARQHAEILSDRRLIDWRGVLSPALRPFDLARYWRGISYDENPGMPDPMERALALKKTLERVDTHLLEGEPFCGSLDSFRLSSLPPWLPQERYQEGIDAEARKGTRSFWGGIDHTLPDYPMLLADGIGGVRRKAEQAEMALGRTDRERTFLGAVMVALDALSLFIGRHADAAERAGDGEMALSLRRITNSPPRGLLDAMRLVWFTHLVLTSEGRGAMALGRADQYLLPCYRRDVEEGILTRREAQDLFCHLWVKIDAMGQVTNICVGGMASDGTDATNELSYLCLEATRLVRSPSTNLSARFHDGTPDDFHVACAKVIRTGIGFPAIFNDHVTVAGLESLGVPASDARDYCMVGCVETMLAGRQPPWSDSRFNLPLCLSAALDELRGRVVLTFNDVWDAFESNVASRLREHTTQVDAHVARYPAEAFSDPLLSALTRDCVARARDLHDGGARFGRYHGFARMGLGTITDSLSAVREAVFIKKLFTFDEVMDAVDADFEGCEHIRRALLNEPKYGNDIPEVDALAARVVDGFTAACLGERMRGGGRFIPLLGSNIQNISAGRELKATTDGRRAFEPLSDSASPSFGRDLRGPTAFLGSVAVPDYTSSVGGTVVNMRFAPEHFAGDEGVRRFVSFLKVFIKRRIHELQFNFTGTETLADAVAHPERYRDLVVRVSGFSAFFVNLPPEVQNDVIRRRAHDAG